jgi:capsular polysaccharide biosynthesis protein
MDPMSVLRTMWKHKWYVLPVVLVTLIVAVYVFQFGPRLYESTMSYALVNPDTPTESEIEADPSLKLLNSDNPYLRASNPTLITDVLISRMNDGETADGIAKRGLSTDFKVEKDAGGNGFVIDITGVGTSAAESLEVTQALSEVLVDNLREVQTVNGADDTYLYTALPVATPNRATEQFSSRLRSVISVLIAGLIVTFGAVSLGRWVETSRGRRTSTERGRRHSDESGRDSARTSGGRSAARGADRGSGSPDRAGAGGRATGIENIDESVRSGDDRVPSGHRPRSAKASRTESTSSSSSSAR